MRALPMVSVLGAIRVAPTPAISPNREMLAAGGRRYSSAAMDPLLVLEVLAAAPIGCVLGFLVYSAWHAIRRYGPPDEPPESKRSPV